ncbi:MAG: hypothetical protein WBB70_14540, partial [Desulfobacterales bacterium]
IMTMSGVNQLMAKLIYGSRLHKFYGNCMKKLYNRSYFFDQGLRFECKRCLILVSGCRTFKK